MHLAESLSSEAAAYWHRVQRFTPNARRVIISQAISRLGFGMYQAIFNLYLLSIGFSTSFVAGLLSLGLFTMAIGALIAGPYTTRVGEKTTMILSGVIMTVAASALITLPIPEILIMMMILFYFGNSLSITSYSPLMARSSSPYERTHLFGTSQASRIGSSFIGSLLGGFLPGLFALWFVVPIDSPLTFQLTLIIWVIASVLGITPLLGMKESRPPAKASEESDLILDSITSPEPRGRISIVLRFIICNILIGLGAGLIVPLINVFFWEFYNLPTYMVGLIIGLGQATMATGVLLSPILSTHIGKVPSVVLTQALSLPFIIILASVVNPLVAIICYLLRNALMNATMPIGQTLRMELVPSSWRPNLQALNTSAMSFGRATSVQFAGQLFDQGLYLIPFWLTLIFYGTQTALYALFFWNAEKQRDKDIKEHETIFPRNMMIETDTH
ncbi:MAG: MFS transporter [Promethearchaeota archaeon]